MAIYHPDLATFRLLNVEKSRTLEGNKQFPHIYDADALCVRILGVVLEERREGGEGGGRKEGEGGREERGHFCRLRHLYADHPTTIAEQDESRV